MLDTKLRPTSAVKSTRQVRWA